MYLAAFLLVPVGAYAWLWWAAGWVFGRQLPMLRVTRPWVVGYAVFFVVYAVVLRNLPWESFTWFTVPNLT
jgi:hypothetical protein